ncbi:hypothetical protein WR25_05465 [Diploscapter pachys]|uniref:Equilibrative nucleoside transporter 3 n=1 Tax=Diploscapter pachys TaxID=2018661 RepID=A0A2A2KMK9_9BILA|nr:hypothetical protein WR25_05465 [Diploscapter pachys]
MNSNKSDTTPLTSLDASGRSNESKDAEDLPPSFADEALTSPSQEDDVEDSNCVVYLIVLLHGLGTLLPWNCFLTIAVDYYTNYKMMESVEDPVTHETKLVPSKYAPDFITYMGIAAQLPNLLLNFVNIFIQTKGDITRRISFSLIIIAAVVAFTMAFINIDTSTWVLGFFVLTLTSIAVLNAANGIYQNSIFGMVSDFPFRYVNAVIIGNNLCGTLVALLSMACVALTNNIRQQAYAYFGISLFTLVICFFSFFILRKRRYFIHYVQKGNRQRELEMENRGKVTSKDYFEAFKQAYPMLINVFLVFFVTLTIFPKLMLGVQSTSDVFGKWWISLSIFLLFNLFAFIGSMLAGFVQFPGPEYLWLCTWPRLLFIPFITFCNYIPATRTLPVLISNDWIYMGGMVLMSVSSGYFSSLAMMYTPRIVHPSKQRIAGMMAGFFLILGIVLGLAFPMVVQWFVEHIGGSSKP